MRASRVSIKQILGIEEIEFSLGKVTVIRGRNGEGKTSIAQAILAAIGGGNDATLVRKGAKRGEAVILLDNGVKIQKRVGAGSGVALDHPQFGPMSKPQTVIDELVDRLSFNPVHFLIAPEKKRTEYLLEVCPIDVTEEMITRAVGDVPVTGLGMYKGLDLIEKNRKAIYDLRTGVNGQAKEKRNLVKQLGESLPEDPSELDLDFAAAIAAADEEIETLQRQRTERDEIAVGEGRRALDEWDAQSGVDGRAFEEDWQQRFEDLRRQMQALEDERKAYIAERDMAREKKKGELIEALNEKRRAIIADIDPQITAAKERRAKLSQQAQEIGRLRNTAELVASETTKAEKHEEQSRAMTAAIEALDALKVELLQQIPVPGLTIEEGTLFVDGVPFDRVNRARQIDVAIQLAKLRAGHLALICVDNLECLDSESFALFVERAAAEEGDVQYIVTRVDDCDLTIETYGDVAAPPENSGIPADYRATVQDIDSELDGEVAA